MPYRISNDALPVLYGDDIYDPSTVIAKSNGVKNIFNLRMNSARIDIEHKFGLTASPFKRLSVKHTWKLMQMGSRVTKFLFSIYFMVNCYTCVRVNKMSTKYRIPTPTVENHLDVTMDDAYDGDDADEPLIERLETQVEEQVEE